MGLRLLGCQVHVLYKVGKIKRTSQNSVEIQNKLFFSSKETLTMKYDHLYNIISYFTLSVPCRAMPCCGSAVISQPMCARPMKINWKIFLQMNYLNDGLINPLMWFNLQVNCRRHGYRLLSYHFLIIQQSFSHSSGDEFNIPVTNKFLACN